LDLVKTWIQGFDEMVGGGLHRPSFILLSGPPGTGKSTFAIQFLLNGINHEGEKGVYVSFHETREIFKRNISKSYNLDIEYPMTTDNLQYLEFPPHSYTAAIPFIFDKIINHVNNNNTQRLVIDSLSVLFNELQSSAEILRNTSFIAEEIVRKKNCTVIGIIEETSDTNGIGIGEALTDGLIKFQCFEDDTTIVKRAVIKRLPGANHSNRFFNIEFIHGQGISFT